jgi:hypothetical protein
MIEPDHPWSLFRLHTIPPPDHTLAGVEGMIVHTLTDELITRGVLITDRNWPSRSLLDMIAKQSPLLDAPVHALIDTGALITGMSNRQVAEYLLAQGLPLDGVIYFDEDNVQMIMEKQKQSACRVEDSSIPVSARFT